MIYFKDMTPGAVGFFFLVLPYFKSSHPFGWCEESVEELADIVHQSYIVVGRYVGELKKRKIIRTGVDGRLYSPLIIQRKI